MWNGSWRLWGSAQWAGVGLVTVCLAQSVTLLWLGSPWPAAATWVGGLLWGGCGALLVAAGLLVHKCWRAQRHGVRMEARHVANETRYSTSSSPKSGATRSSSYLVEVYEVTDQHGRVLQHAHVARGGREPRPTRTVLVVPGEDSAQTPLATYLIPLLALPFVAGLGLFLGAVAFAVLPGLLLR